MYISQKVVKGQILVNFFVDLLTPNDWEVTNKIPDEYAMFTEIQPLWKMYFDGGEHHG